MYRKIISLILCIFCIFILTSCSKSNTVESKKTNIKYVDIYDIVKEAFLTDKGYTNDLSKYMTKKVFNHMNYKMYNVDDPEYKKPFKIDFDLKEVFQTKDNDTADLVYVDMVYSILITDATGKTVGGAWDIPIQFTVKTTGDKWYIINKFEE